MKEKYANQAKAYKHTLNLGIVEVAEISDWANQLIATQCLLDQKLTKLASDVNQQQTQVLAILAQFNPAIDDDTWWLMIKERVGVALINGIVSAEKITSYFHNLALDGEIPAYDCEALYQFELEYSCLSEGFSSQDEIDMKVMKFLIRH